MHLLRLFKSVQCTGIELNCLIELLIKCVTYNEGNADDRRHLLNEPEYFEPLWRLYFDPLLIISVQSTDANAQREAPGRSSYLTSKPISAKWSDGREDMCRDGIVAARIRVDEIVHMALNPSLSQEQLIRLLDKIHLGLADTNYLFTAWLQLYRHLIQLPCFDVSISDIMFDRLKDTELSHRNQIFEFILNLFDVWPTLSDPWIKHSVSIHITQFIEQILLDTTSEAQLLANQLFSRICSNTPAQNAKGHICYYILLKDVLPLYSKANLISSIKTVPLTTLTWYARYILRADMDESLFEHRSTLLDITKYVSIFTEHDLLDQWIQQATSHADDDDEFPFHLIEQSLCRTSTLMIYTQHVSNERIQQLLNCMQSTTARHFIPVFLLICEALAQYTQAQEYLFRSDIHSILQTWLQTVDNTPSISVRMLKLLLDIGYSKYSRHSIDIARFLLEEYHTKLLVTNFEESSPLVNIILFLSWITTNVDDTDLHLSPDSLFTELFQLLDTDSEENNAICSSHLKSICKEIVQPTSHETLVKLLLPFTADIMGVLGRSGGLKTAGICLFAEVLDLSQNERETLAENVQQRTPEQEKLIHTTELASRYAFFSTEVIAKKEFVHVKNEDFLKADKLLTTLKRSEPSQVDHILRAYVPTAVQQPSAPVANDSHQRLVLTATARENVAKVLEVLDDPIPILLEGSTGVGKSASIMEAAIQVERQLVRYNMSSRVTIDDLLGKVALVSDVQTQGTKFQFINGPFTIAFSNGYWMLFDELNLAQDTVLQAIESALDTQQLTIRDTSSAEKPVVVYSMHKNFRLFATQNPNSGFFKGKREKLSASFLSRFRPLIFKELPDQEWIGIVQSRLQPNFADEAQGLAELMVKTFNVTLKKEMLDSNHPFEEVGPYSEISIRELLKWIDLLIWQYRHGQWPREVPQRAALLSFSAWCVYGARYRHAGRVRIEKILNDSTKCGWPVPAIYSVRFSINEQLEQILFDDIQCSIRMEKVDERPEIEWMRSFKQAGHEDIDFEPNVWKTALEAHKSVHKAILSENFIRTHGIYRINRSWLWEWLLSSARSHILLQRTELARRGCIMYQSRFRHRQAQAIVQECFINVFRMNRSAEPFQSMARAEIPYILTERSLSALKQICFNMRIKQPILLTGGEGCGKSELLLALGWLYGKRIHQLNITPETEPSALIGQLIPNETTDPDDPSYGEKFIWQNGCVTQGYTNGEWVLLDNLGTAESSVLERLNPVLEQKPMLILTEKGDVTEQTRHDEYQLVATMTPPDPSQRSSNVSGSSNELSPALYNRFAVIHMEDHLFDVQGEREIRQLTEALLSDDASVEHDLAVSMCRQILSAYKANKESFPKLTLRNIVRLLDSTFLLRQKFESHLDFPSSLWTAYHVTIANQIKGDLKHQVSDDIQKLLLRNRPPTQTLHQPQFSAWIEQSNEHILTATRQEYANAVLGAVACNIPLLLEGPAAVGKTALISYLCKHMKSEFINSHENRMRLERVNNTDTTTIQDYLGTFLPANNGFIFQQGALYRAMVSVSHFSTSSLCLVSIF